MMANCQQGLPRTHEQGQAMDTVRPMHEANVSVCSNSNGVQVLVENGAMDDNENENMVEGEKGLDDDLCKTCDTCPLVEGTVFLTSMSMILMMLQKTRTLV